MNNKTTQALVLAAATLFSAGMAFANDKPATPVEGKIKCVGANACKGHSACQTASNSCKGMNGCKGKGMSETTVKECKDKGLQELK
jgi:uncharacterized membrane protein